MHQHYFLILAFEITKLVDITSNLTYNQNSRVEDLASSFIKLLILIGYIGEEVQVIESIYDVRGFITIEED